MRPVRYSVGFPSPGILQSISDYLNIVVAALLMLWVGTDLTVRILAPFWPLAADMVLPLRWTVMFLIGWATLYLAALCLQKVVLRSNGRVS